MENRSYDIVISGGGVAGLAAAAGFGAAGFSVLCVDPTPPVTVAVDPGADLRTTALLQPSVRVLDAAGVWERLVPQAAPLQVMRIVDAGDRPDLPIIREFDAGDISDQPFGWNLPNWLLRRELLARLAELPTVAFRPGVATTGIVPRSAEALVRLNDGTQVSARLVIAADGHNSPMREVAGIGVKTTRFGQKALVFAVTHAVPHLNVSTEVHRSGGPFTLVPLPDRDGQPCSAVVWMERGPEAHRLMTLTEAAFEVEMSERSCHLFGPLRLASRRSLWPIIAQLADRFDGPRLALMAEAAHVLPPIGAQGLNMSLTDLSVLLELAGSSPDRLGDRDMLGAYQQRRWRDAKLRVAGISALNRASMAGSPMAQAVRAKGLEFLYGLKPLRRTLMQAGLGAAGRPDEDRLS